MRHLRRILVSAATLLSLAVLLLAVAAFIGSDMPGDLPWHWGEWHDGGPFRRLTLAKIQFELECYAPAPIPSPSEGRRTVDWRFAGLSVDNFGFITAPLTAVNIPSVYYAGWHIVVPVWAVALLTALLPVRWIVVNGRTWVSGRRHGRGLCPTCGYDLRATPERCPECGTAPTK